MRRRTRALAGLAAAASCCLVAAAPAASSARYDRALDTVAAPRGELVQTSSLEVPGGGRIVRYAQRVGGLPVLDAEAVVVTGAGAPDVLTDDTEPALVPVDERPGISRGAAIAAAKRYASVTQLRAPSRARLGIDRSGALAWRVSLPAADPLGDFMVTVDADSGDRIEVRDLLARLTGSATIFDPNPVTTQGSYNGLKDAKDHDSDLLTSLRQPVALERLTSPEGCLVGIYAEAKLGKKPKPVCAPNADFTALTRSDDRFEAVMSYYHVDHTRAYVDSLGLTEPLRQKPQRIRADAIKQDNSFFSPMIRTLTFGTGGVDDGEDADVINHEYGHSLQDQAVHNFGLSVSAGSMGEGFGDYLAAAMSAERTGGSEFDPCIFDWDGISYSPTGCGRRADKPLTLSKAQDRCRREVHCLGQAWSSVLYGLRGTIGDDPAGLSVMDRVVLESHFMLVPRATFRDGARALIKSDQLLYAGAHVPTIEAALVARKFCKPKGC